MVYTPKPNLIEILLIEDSPSDAELTIREFGRANIANNLRWIEDGETAIAYLRQQELDANAARIDLILLDLNLPGMDGREILEEIKSDPNLKKIPVIVLTSSEAEEDIIRSYNLSANCYITKPVDVRQFIHVIQQINDFWLAIVKLP